MHKKVCLFYDLRKKIVQNSLCTYEDMFLFFVVVAAAVSSFGKFFRSEDLEHLSSCEMEKKFFSFVRSVCFVGRVWAVVGP